MGTREQRENPPHSAAELSEAVTEAWQRLTQNAINQLVVSMPRRVAALLHAEGCTHSIDFSNFSNYVFYDTL